MEKEERFVLLEERFAPFALLLAREGERLGDGSIPQVRAVHSRHTLCYTVVGVIAGQKRW